MASAAVKTSTPTAVETSSAAEARLPASRKPTRNASVIKAAERARVTTGVGTRYRGSMWGYKSML